MAVDSPVIFGHFSCAPSFEAQRVLAQIDAFCIAITPTGTIWALQAEPGRLHTSEATQVIGRAFSKVVRDGQEPTLGTFEEALEASVTELRAAQVAAAAAEEDKDTLGKLAKYVLHPKNALTWAVLKDLPLKRAFGAQEPGQFRGYQELDVLVEHATPEGARGLAVDVRKSIAETAARPRARGGSAACVVAIRAEPEAPIEFVLSSVARAAAELKIPRTADDIALMVGGMLPRGSNGAAFEAVVEAERELLEWMREKWPRAARDGRTQWQVLGLLRRGLVAKADEDAASVLRMILGVLPEEPPFPS
jgi:hypothetical protein